jgi:light-independent protochlorophyllide reductase subunit B
MELSLWTYEGPPHVGAIRIANSMRGVHLMLHAPQGDSYADLLFTMIERDDHRPPVTYTTFQARDLGSDTAELVLRTVRAAVERHSPRCCWSATPAPPNCCRISPAPWPAAAASTCRWCPMEMLAYSRKENWGAGETFYTLVRALLQGRAGTGQRAPARRSARPASTCSARVPRLPLPRRRARSHPAAQRHGRRRQRRRAAGRQPHDLLRIPEADANVCLYPEVAGPACDWLARNFKQPTIKTVPIGVGATGDFIDEVASDPRHRARPATGRLASALVLALRGFHLPHRQARVRLRRCHARHRRGAHRQPELAFEVVGLGTYSREQARGVRSAAKELGLERPDQRQLSRGRARISDLQPELVLGRRWNATSPSAWASPAP